MELMPGNSDRRRQTPEKSPWKRRSRAPAIRGATARQARIPGAPATVTASTRPSGAVPSTTRPGAQLVDALGVHGVHHGGVPAGDPRQHAAGRETHLVDRGVLGLERRALVLPVIQLARDVVDLLVQACRHRRR